MTKLNVIPQQRMLMTSTGSELVSPGTPLQPVQIYESNLIMLAGAVRDAGPTLVASFKTRDEVAQFSTILDCYACTATSG